LRFSVHAGERIEPTQQESLERMARYMTRAPIALGTVFEQKNGQVKLLTPPNPKTGEHHLLFDPLVWVHAVTTRFPMPVSISCTDPRLAAHRGSAFASKGKGGPSAASVA